MENATDNRLSTSIDKEKIWLIDVLNNLLKDCQFNESELHWWRILRTKSLDWLNDMISSDNEVRQALYHVYFSIDLARTARRGAQLPINSKTVNSYRHAQARQATELVNDLWLIDFDSSVFSEEEKLNMSWWVYEGLKNNVLSAYANANFEWWSWSNKSINIDIIDTIS